MFSVFCTNDTELFYTLFQLEICAAARYDKATKKQYRRNGKTSGHSNINWAKGTVIIKIFRLYRTIYKVTDSQNECFGSNSRDRVQY